MEKRRPRYRGLGLKTLMQSCRRSKIHSPRPKGREAVAKEEAEQTITGIETLPDDLLLECLARLNRPSVQSALLVSQRFKSLMKGPLYYDHRRRLGKLESLVFVFGGAGIGLSSTIFCKSSGVWGSGLLFSPRLLRGNEWFLDYHNSDNSLLYAQAATVRNEIYILSALPCYELAYRKDCCSIVYDVWEQRLSRRASMINPRKKFACCVISERIYVAGGALLDDSSREAISLAEMYVPELDVWRPLANMPRKRYGCLGAAVKGLFYVIGGVKSGNMNAISVEPYAYVGSMDTFDTNTNTWLKSKALPKAMAGCVISCTVVGCCIYMLSSHAVELSFWKYMTDSDSWIRIKAPPIPSPLRLDNVLKFSCVTVLSSIYVIQVGGSIDDLLTRAGDRRIRGSNEEALLLIYDTKFQVWQRGPDLPYVHNGATCAVVEC